ncbi:hypothetical protein FDB50_15470 [Clostridium botulinum]|uniref:Uncharacterized protein n=1 Tax=Clostridium botulinum TaxID=1491 RepID=A0A846JU18_CLOBO|nr:hypothetical protein [Clostridium botulinum]NFN36439.1 hypothetical protein [Clostridium botulinum]
MLTSNLYYEILKNVNPENYEFWCEEAKTEDELKSKVLQFEKKYCEEYDIDQEDFNPIELRFNGSGIYDIAGLEFGSGCALKIEEIFNNELISFEDKFPFTINLDFFSDNEKWKKEVKKSEQYKYIYLINHCTHVTVPHKYRTDYVIFSDNELSEENIKDYFEENEIFIGEFGQFFANYFIEELNKVDPEQILKYEDNSERIYMIED